MVIEVVARSIGQARRFDLGQLVLLDSAWAPTAPAWTRTGGPSRGGSVLGQIGLLSFSLDLEVCLSPRPPRTK